MAAPNGDDSEVGVRIGIREIYDHVRDLVRAVDMVSRQIDVLTQGTTKTSAETDGLDTRVRTLEVQIQKVVTPASMWTAIGVLAGVAGTVATVIALMMQR